MYALAPSALPSRSPRWQILTQPKALDFAGLGLRQCLDKFHRTRIFERRNGRLDMILQTLRAFRARRHPLLEHDMGLNDLAALFVCDAAHRAFLDVRMR